MSLKLPIYLDYSATTPVDDRVAEQMSRYLTRDGVFGNP
ncbi:cysteine desulfurase, partial [Thioalkalivibrio denitrificans]